MNAVSSTDRCRCREVECYFKIDYLPEAFMSRITGRMLSFVALTSLLLDIAHAADRGDCGTPEEMKAKLAQDDQHNVAQAIYMKPDNHPHGIIVTASTDGKVGYVLERDALPGDPATKICVFERIGSIRLFDYRKAGTPQQVFIKTPDAEAQRKCDAWRKAGEAHGDDCQPLNQIIREGERWGQRVFLEAPNMARQKDGTYQEDGSMTIILGAAGTSHDFPGQPEKGVEGDVWQTLLPEGASLRRAVLAYLQVTEWGQALLAPKR